jgi:hypothetical protein
VMEPFDIVQHEDRAATRGQTGDRVFQIHACLRPGPR